MGGCRFRRGQAGCQGGLRLVQQHHHHQLVHQHHRHQNHHHRKAGCQRRAASATTPTHTKVSSLQSGWLGNVEFYKRISFSSGWLPCRPTSSTTLNPQVAPNSSLIDISPRLLWRRLLFFLQDSFDVSNLLCVSTSGFQSFKSLSRLGLLNRPTEN